MLIVILVIELEGGKQAGLHQVRFLKNTTCLLSAGIKNVFENPDLMEVYLLATL